MSNNSMVVFQNSNAIVGRTGKVIGSTLSFIGGKSAKEVADALRAEGLKGKELKLKVNEVLTGKLDLAWAQHDAAVSVLRSNGYIPSKLDARATNAVNRYVKPAAVKGGAKLITADDVAAMSDEQRETLRKLLGA
jgi:hypothetical protein